MVTLALKKALKWLYFSEVEATANSGILMGLKCD